MQHGGLLIGLLTEKYHKGKLGIGVSSNWCPYMLLDNRSHFHGTEGEIILGSPSIRVEGRAHSGLGGAYVRRPTVSSPSQIRPQS